MTMPKVKEECVLAVLQKATHTNTMEGFALKWMHEFVEQQPALATPFSTWITHYGDDISDDVVNGFAALVGIMMESVRTQLEANELEEGENDDA